MFYFMDISIDDALNLFILGLRLSVPVIADLLDLSERPLYRIIKKYGLRDRPQVELNDAELDAAVSAILAVFPNSGESSHLIIWKVFLCCG